MRGGGLGGPLLCIGDLLSDVGEEQQQQDTTPADIIASVDVIVQPSDLPLLFQESYKRLDEALDGTSHSWTTHTLELCSALETANKLIQSSSSYVMDLSHKIQKLESITKKGNLVVKEAESIHISTKAEGHESSDK
uniref:uncharacterized protein LOC122589025 n=1 Tax=Erigeron canadensis TaxID=72917 RepID=UPI001CB8CADF|nr:uncharacterized protein LOC122589025 [Erigeron canadensis]